MYRTLALGDKCGLGNAYSNFSSNCKEKAEDVIQQCLLDQSSISSKISLYPCERKMQTSDWRIDYMTLRNPRIFALVILRFRDHNLGMEFVSVLNIVEASYSKFSNILHCKEHRTSSVWIRA